MIEAAEKHFADHPKGQGSGWKGYQRWKYWNERTYYPSGDRMVVAPDHVRQEARKFRQAYPEKSRGTSRDSDDGLWTERGPFSANNVTGSWSPGLGRVETFYINPNNTSQMYLGSRSGGFWRTDDGGVNWECTTDTLAVIGIPSMAVSPHSPDSIYIATRTQYLAYSIGVWRSVDGGDTWQPTGLNLNLTGDATSMAKLAIHPMNSKLMYVGTSEGLYRSYDNFQTWDTLLAGKNITDFEFMPGSANTLFAYSSAFNDRDQVFVSHDQGSSFTQTTVPGVGFVFGSEIAVTAADPAYVYFGTDEGVYRSVDTGNTFVFMGPEPTSMMSFGVSDTDADRVLFGGLDTYLSTNGGTSFTQVTNWVGQAGMSDYIHADLREVFSLNGAFYVGTDGYLARSLNGGTSWTVLSDGCGIREYYDIGGTPLDVGKVIGGSQDNGTSVLDESGWREWMGADGMECTWSNSYNNILFGTWQFGGLHISRNSGVMRQYISPDESGGSWVTPFRLDPNHPTTIFAGYDTLYRSSDHGETWEALADFTAFGNLDNMEISKYNSDVLYVTEFERLWGSTDGGNTWNFIDNGIPKLYISDIAIADDSPQHVAVSFRSYDASNRVFETTTGTFPWTNLTYNLPNIPVNALVYGPDGVLYAGTDIGVYYLEPGSTTWESYIFNLPNGQVTELQIHKGANRLQAGMWGRGLWEAPLLGREDYPEISVINAIPAFEEGAKPTAGDTVAILATITDNGTIMNAWVEWSVDTLTFANTRPMALSGNDTYETVKPLPKQPEGSLVYFRVLAMDDNGDTTCTDHVVYEVHPLHCLAQGAPGTGGDYITRVQLNTLDNTSGKDAYSNFANQVTELFRDSTYTLEMTLNFAFPEDAAFAWIDYDNNGLFDNATERITMGPFSATHVSTGTFTVPATALLDTVRLRVRNTYNANFPDPCNSYFGEVEDYSVAITVAPPDTSVNVGLNGVLGDNGLTVRLFPNPLDGPTLQAEVVASPEWQDRSLRLVMTDLKGSLVTSRSGIVLQAGQQQLSVPVPQNVANGTYVIRLEATDNGTPLATRQLVLQR
ncbi:MAG: GEVED domain-containing protein [Bacteroidota bacterium]